MRLAVKVPPLPLKLIGFNLPCARIFFFVYSIRVRKEGGGPTSVGLRATKPHDWSCTLNACYILLGCDSWSMPAMLVV